MKKFVQRFILLIAAATVFFTGAGVTIINYCCTSCSGQTLIMTEKHVCCVQGQHEAKSSTACCSAQKETIHNDSCENAAFSQDMHCTASRLSMDIDASSFRPHISVPFVWISDALPDIPVSTSFDTVTYADGYTAFGSPPGIPPREYLSLIRILII
jgi:hypothetical protein